MIITEVKTEKLLRILARNNMTQGKLAELCGVSDSIISQILSGNRNPSAETRQRIMDALNVKSFDLIFKIKQEAK